MEQVNHTFFEHVWICAYTNRMSLMVPLQKLLSCNSCFAEVSLTQIQNKNFKYRFNKADCGLPKLHPIPSDIDYIMKGVS